MLQFNLYIVIAGLSLANALTFEDETNWQGYCHSNRQSPINVVTENTVNVTDWEERLRFSGYSRPLNWKIKNSGSHIKVMNYERNEEEKIILRGGGLQGIYYAVSINVFWEKGSLHSLAGQFYSMEWEIVHMKKAYKTMREALTKPDGIAVLTFFANVSNVENGPLEEFSEQVGKIREYKDLTDLPTNFSLSTLVNAVNQYQFYTYFGSITTPPCYESSYYMLFPKIIPISRKSFSYFQALLNFIDPESRTAVRSLQKLNDRSIYFYNIMKPVGGTPRITTSELAMGIQPSRKNVPNIFRTSNMKNFIKYYPNHSDFEISFAPDKESINEFRPKRLAVPESPGVNASAAYSGRPSVPKDERTSASGTSIFSKTQYGTPLGSIISTSGSGDIPSIHNTSTPPVTSRVTPLIKDAGYKSIPRAPQPNKILEHPSFPSPSTPYEKSDRHRSISGSVIPSDLQYGLNSISSTSPAYNKSNDFSSKSGALIQWENPPIEFKNNPSWPTFAKLLNKIEKHLSTAGTSLPHDQQYGQPSIASTSAPYDNRNRYLPNGKPLVTKASSPSDNNGTFSSIQGVTPQANKTDQDLSWSSSGTLHERRHGTPSDLPYSSTSISNSLKPFDNGDDYSSKPGATLSNSDMPSDRNVKHPSIAGTDFPHDNQNNHPSIDSISTQYGKQEGSKSVPSGGIPSIYSTSPAYSNRFDYLSKLGAGMPSIKLKNHPFWPRLEKLLNKDVKHPSIAGTSYPFDQQYGQPSITSISAPYDNRNGYLPNGKPSVTSASSQSDNNGKISSIQGVTPQTNQTDDDLSWSSSGTLHDMDFKNQSIHGTTLSNHQQYGHPSFPSDSTSYKKRERRHGIPSDLPYDSTSISNSLSPFDNVDGYSAKPGATLSSSDMPSDRNVKHPSIAGTDFPHDNQNNHPSIDSISTQYGKQDGYKSVSSGGIPSDGPIAVSSPSPQFENSDGHTSIPVLPPNKINYHPYWTYSNRPIGEDDHSIPGYTLPYDQQYSQKSVGSISTKFNTHDQYASDSSLDSPTISNSSLLDSDDSYPPLPGASLSQNKIDESDYTRRNEHYEYQLVPNPNLEYDHLYGQPSVASISNQYKTDNRCPPYLPFGSPNLSSSSLHDSNEDYASVSESSLSPIKVKDNSSPPYSDTQHKEEERYKSFTDQTFPSDELYGQPSGNRNDYTSVTKTSISPANVDYHPSYTSANKPHSKEDMHKIIPELYFPYDEQYGQPSVATFSEIYDTYENHPFHKTNINPTISTSSTLDKDDDYSLAQQASFTGNKINYHPTSPISKNPPGENDIYKLKPGHNFPYDQQYSQPSVESISESYGTDTLYPSYSPFGHPSISTTSSLDNNENYPSVSAASLQPNTVDYHSSSHSSYKSNGKEDKYKTITELTSPYEQQYSQPSFSSISTPYNTQVQYPSDQPYNRPYLSTSSLLDKNEEYPSEPEAYLTSNTVESHYSSHGFKGPPGKDSHYNLNKDQPPISSTSMPYDIQDQYPTDLPFDRPYISTSSPLNNNAEYPSEPEASLPPNTVDYHSSPHGSNGTPREDDRYNLIQSPTSPYDDHYDQPPILGTSTPYGSQDQYPSNLPFDHPYISTSSPLNNNEDYTSNPETSLPPHTVDYHSSSPGSYGPPGKDDKYNLIQVPTSPNDDQYDQPPISGTSTLYDSQDHYPSNLPFDHPYISTFSPLNNNEGYPSHQETSLPPNTVDYHFSSPGSNGPPGEDDIYNLIQVPTSPYDDQYDQPHISGTYTPYDSQDQYPSNLPFDHPYSSTSSPLNNNEDYPSNPELSLPPHTVDYHSPTNSNEPRKQDGNYNLNMDQRPISSTSIPFDSQNQYPSDIQSDRPYISTSSLLDKNEEYPSEPEAYLTNNIVDYHSSSPGFNGPHGKDSHYNLNTDQPPISSASIPYDIQDQYPCDVPFDRPYISTSSPLHNNEEYPTEPDASLPSKVDYHSPPPGSNGPPGEDDKYNLIQEPTLPYDDQYGQQPISDTSRPYDLQDQYPSYLPFDRPNITTSSPLDNNEEYPSEPDDSLPPNTVNYHSSPPGSNGTPGEDDKYNLIQLPTSPYDDQYDKPPISDTSTPYNPQDQYPSNLPFHHPYISNSSPLNNNEEYPSEPDASLPPNTVDYHSSPPGFNGPTGKDDIYNLIQVPTSPYGDQYGEPPISDTSTPHDLQDQYQSNLPFDRPFISTSTPLNNNEEYQSEPEASLPPNTVDYYSSPSGFNGPPGEDDKYNLILVPTSPYDDQYGQTPITSTFTPYNPQDQYPSDIQYDHPSISTSSPLDNNEDYQSEPEASLPPNTVEYNSSPPGSNGSPGEDDKYNLIQVPTSPYDDQYGQPPNSETSTPYDLQDQYPSNLPFDHPSISTSSPLDNNEEYPTELEASLPPNTLDYNSFPAGLNGPPGGDDNYNLIQVPTAPYDDQYGQTPITNTFTPYNPQEQYPSDIQFYHPSISTSSPLDNNEDYQSEPEASLSPNTVEYNSSPPGSYGSPGEDDKYNLIQVPTSPYDDQYGQPPNSDTSTPYDLQNQYPSNLPFDRPSISTSSPLDYNEDYPTEPEASLPPNTVEYNSSPPNCNGSPGEDGKYNLIQVPTPPYDDQYGQPPNSDNSTPYDLQGQYPPNLPIDRPSISTFSPLDNNEEYPSEPEASLPPNTVDYNSSPPGSNGSPGEDDKYNLIQVPTSPYDDQYGQPPISDTLTPYDLQDQYPSNLPFDRPSISTSSPLDNNEEYLSEPEDSLPPNTVDYNSSPPGSNGSPGEDDKYNLIQVPTSPYDDQYGQPPISETSTPYDLQDQYPSNLPFARPSISTSSPLDNNEEYLSELEDSLPPNTVDYHSSPPGSNGPTGEDDKYNLIQVPTSPYDDQYSQPPISSTSTPYNPQDQYPSDLQFDRPSISTSSPLDYNEDYPTEPEASLPPNTVEYNSSPPNSNGSPGEDDKYNLIQVPTPPYDDQYGQPPNSDNSTPYDLQGQYPPNLPIDRPSISTFSPLDNNEEYLSELEDSLPPNTVDYHSSPPGFNGPPGEDDKYNFIQVHTSPYDNQYGQPPISDTSTPYTPQDQYPFDLQFDRPSTSTSSPLDNNEDYTSEQDTFLPPNTVDYHSSPPGFNGPSGKDDKYNLIQVPTSPYDDQYGQPPISDTSTPYDLQDQYPSNLPFDRPSISTSSPLDNNEAYPNEPEASLPPNTVDYHSSPPGSNGPPGEDDIYNLIHVPTSPYDDQHGQPPLSDTSTPYDLQDQYPSNLPFDRSSISTSSPLDNNEEFPSEPEASLPPNTVDYHSSPPGSNGSPGEDDKYNFIQVPTSPYDDQYGQPPISDTSTPYNPQDQYPSDLQFDRPSISTSSPLDNNEEYPSELEASLPPNTVDYHSSPPGSNGPPGEDDKYNFIQVPTSPYDDQYGQPLISDTSTPYNPQDQYPSDLQFDRPSISTSSPLDNNEEYPSVLEASLPPNTVDYHSSPPGSNGPPGEDVKYNFIQVPTSPYDDQYGQPPISDTSTPYNPQDQYPSDLQFDRPSISTSSPLDNNEEYPSVLEASLPPNTVDYHSSPPGSNGPPGEDDKYNFIQVPTSPYDDQYGQPPISDTSTPYNPQDQYPSDLQFDHPSISTSSPLDNNEDNTSEPETSLPPNTVDYHSSPPGSNGPPGEDDKYNFIQVPTSPYDDQYGQPPISDTSTPYSPQDQYPSDLQFDRPSISTSSPLDNNEEYPSELEASLPPNTVDYHSSPPGSNGPPGEDDKYNFIQVLTSPYDDQYGQPPISDTSTPYNPQDQYPSDLQFDRPSISTSSPLDNNEEYPSVLEASLPPNTVDYHSSPPGSNGPPGEDDKYNFIQVPTSPYDDQYGQPPISDTSTPYNPQDQYPSDLQFDHPSISTSSPLDNNEDYTSEPETSLPPNTVDYHSSPSGSNGPPGEDDKYNFIQVPTSPYDDQYGQPPISDTSTPYNPQDQYPSNLQFDRPSISTSSPLDNNEDYTSEPETFLPPNTVDYHSSPPGSNGPPGKDDIYNLIQVPTSPYDDQYGQPPISDTSTPYNPQDQYPSDLQFDRPSISTSSPLDNNEDYTSEPETFLPPNTVDYHSSPPGSNGPPGEDDKYNFIQVPTSPYDDQYGQPPISDTSTPYNPQDQYPSDFQFDRPSISTSSPLDNNEDYTSEPETFLPPNTVDYHSSPPGSNGPPGEDDKYNFIQVPTSPYDDQYGQPPISDTSTPYNPQDQYPSDSQFDRPSISTSSPLDNNEDYTSEPETSLPPNTVDYHSSPPGSNGPPGEDDKYNFIQVPTSPYDDQYGQPPISDTSTPYDLQDQYPSNLPFDRPSISTSSPLDNNEEYPSELEASLPPNTVDYHSSPPGSNGPPGEDDKYNFIQVPTSLYDDQYGQPPISDTSTPYNPQDQYPSDLQFDRPSISTSSPLDNNEDYTSGLETFLPPNTVDYHSSPPGFNGPPGKDDTYNLIQEPFSPYDDQYGQPPLSDTSTPYDLQDQYPSNLPFDRPSISTSSPLDNNEEYPSEPEASLPPNTVDYHSSPPCSNGPPGEDDKYNLIQVPTSPYDDKYGQPPVSDTSTPYDFQDQYLSNLPFDRPSISSTSPLYNNEEYPSGPEASLLPNTVDYHSSPPGFNGPPGKDDTYNLIQEPFSPYDDQYGQPPLSDTSTPYDLQDQYPSNLPFDRPSISTSSPFDNNEDYTSEPETFLPPNTVEYHSSPPGFNGPPGKDDKYNLIQVPTSPYDDEYGQPPISDTSTPYDLQDQYPSNLPFDPPSISTSSPLDNNEEYPSEPEASLPPNTVDYSSSPPGSNGPPGKDDKYNFIQVPTSPYDDKYGQPPVSDTSTPYDFQDQYPSNLPFDRPSISSTSPLYNNEEYPSGPEASLPPNTVDYHSSSPGFNGPPGKDDIYNLMQEPFSPYDDQYGQPPLSDTSTPYDLQDQYPSNLPFDRPSISTSSPLDNNEEYPSEPEASLPPNTVDYHSSSPCSNGPPGEDDKYNLIQVPTSPYDDKYGQPPLSDTSTPYDLQDQYPSNLPFDRPSISTSSPLDNNEEYPSEPEASLPPNTVDFHSSPPGFNRPPGEDDKYNLIQVPTSPYDDQYGQPPISDTSTPYDLQDQYSSNLPFDRPSISTSSPLDNNEEYPSEPDGFLPSNTVDYHSSLPGSNGPPGEDDKYNLIQIATSPYDDQYGQPPISSTSISYNAQEQYPSDLQFDRPSISTSSPLDKNEDYQSEPETSLPHNTVDYHSSSPGFNRPPGKDSHYNLNTDQPPISSTSIPYDIPYQYPSNLLFDHPCISTSSPLNNNEEFPSEPEASLPPNTVGYHSSPPGSNGPAGEDDKYNLFQVPTSPYEDQYGQPPISSTSTPNDSRDQYPSDLQFDRPSISTSSPLNNNEDYPSNPETSLPPHTVDYHSSSPGPNGLPEKDDKYNIIQGPTSPYDDQYGRPPISSTSTPYDIQDQYPSDLQFDRPSISTSSSPHNNDDYPSEPEASLPPNTVDSHSSSPGSNEPPEKYSHYDLNADQPPISSTLIPYEIQDEFPSDLPFNRPFISTSSPLNNNEDYPSYPETCLPPHTVDYHSSSPGSNGPPEKDDKYNIIQKPTLPYDDQYGQTPISSTSTPYDIQDQYPSNLQFVLPIVLPFQGDRPSISTSSPLNNNEDYPFNPETSLPPNTVDYHSSSPGFNGLPGKDSHYNLNTDQPPISGSPIPYDIQDQYPFDLPFDRPSISTSSPFNNNEDYPSNPETFLPPNTIDYHSSSPGSNGPPEKDDIYNIIQGPTSPYDDQYGQPPTSSASTPYDSQDQYSSDLQFDRPSIFTSSPLNNNEDYPFYPETSLPPNAVDFHSSSRGSNEPPGEDDKYSLIQGYDDQYGQPPFSSTSIPYDSQDQYPSDLQFDRPSLSISSPFNNNEDYPSYPETSLPPNTVDHHSSPPGSNEPPGKDIHYDLNADQPPISSTLIPYDIQDEFPSDLPFDRPFVSTSSPLNNNEDYPSNAETSLPPHTVDYHSSSPGSNGSPEKDDKYNIMQGPTSPYDDQYGRPPISSTSTPYDIQDQYPSDLQFDRPSISTSSPPHNNDDYPSEPEASLPPNTVDSHSSSPGSNEPPGEDGTSTIYGSQNEYPSYIHFDRPSFYTTSPLERNEDYQSEPEASVQPNSVYYPSSSPDFNGPPGKDSHYDLNTDTSTAYDSLHQFPSNLQFDRPYVSTSSPPDHSDGNPSVPGSSLPPHKVDDLPGWPSSNTPHDQDYEYPSNPESIWSYDKQYDQPTLSCISTTNEQNTSDLPPNKFDDHPSAPSSDITHNKYYGYPLKPVPTLPNHQQHDKFSISSISTPYYSEDRHLSNSPFGQPPFSTSSSIYNSNGYTSVPGVSQPTSNFGDHPSLASFDTPLDEDYEYRSISRPNLPYEQQYGQPSSSSVSTLCDADDSTSSQLDNNVGYPTVPKTSVPPNKVCEHSCGLCADAPHANDAVNIPCIKVTRRNLHGAVSGVWWQRLWNGVNALFTDIAS